MDNLEKFLAFKAVGNVDFNDRGLEADFGSERLRIQLIREDLIRIKVSRGGFFDELPTYALCVDPLDQQVQFEASQNDKVATLTTSQIRIELHLNPFALNVYRTDGSAVIETTSFKALNDAFVITRKIAAKDPIYGLGEKTGKQNRRGRDFNFWNTDVLNPNASGEFTRNYDPSNPRADKTSTEFDPYYASIPFFYHQDAKTSAMAGSWIDNSYRGHYDFRDKGEYSLRFEGGQYTEYVFAGPSMAKILEQYTWLTGRTALPPIWALGYHQCRWQRYSQDDVLALAEKHKKLEIPLDVLWLDIDYMDEYRVFTWNTELFPDAPGMLQNLRDQGVRVVTIIDPGVKLDPGYSVHDDGIAKDVFARTEGGGHYVGQVWPGDTLFPDFANEDARRWWGELNAQHVQSGLAGIWNDMNEPATGDIEPYTMRFDRGRESHLRRHNEYATLMAMGTVEGLQAAMPELRTFVLSRAGSPGIQRYAANWMGDNCSRWDHLWMSIPMGTGFSISGQSFVGADIGGFAEDTNEELFLRWMQCGAFTPFARNHNQAGQVDQYVWSFSKETLDASRRALQTRYRLMPYIYSAFVEASQTAAPIQRPVIFDYQTDEKARELDTQYLFGSQLMIAPVLEAGAKTRDIYLPAGEWFDFWTDKSQTGGKSHKAKLSRENIPVFVKAGAVLPMWPEVPGSTHGYAPKQIELHVYVPSSDGEFTSMLQEDDGLTTAANGGGFVRTQLSLIRKGKKLTLAGEVLGAGFAEFARESFKVVLHGAKTAKGETELVVANAGESFKIEIALSA